MSEMDVERLKELNCFVMRRTPSATPFCKRAEQEAEDFLAEVVKAFVPGGQYGRGSNDPRDLSTSLICCQMDPEKYAGFCPIDVGSEPWPLKSVPEKIDSSYYKIIETPIYRCLAINSVHQLEIPFPQKEGKSWPAEKELIEDQVKAAFRRKLNSKGADYPVSVDSRAPDGVISDYKARLCVRHTPSVLNYWHISLQVEIKTPESEAWITLMRDDNSGQNLDKIIKEEAKAVIKRILDMACLQIFLDRLLSYDAALMMRTLPESVYLKTP
ncbi:MAG: hypothetical protein IJ228_08695 [Succinivibrio sp.]|nr:hypothetical protein [Succinivibrio sp.]